jgi:glucosylceramidase
MFLSLACCSKLDVPGAVTDSKSQDGGEPGTGKPPIEDDASTDEDASADDAASSDAGAKDGSSGGGSPMTNAYVIVTTSSAPFVKSVVSATPISASGAADVELTTSKLQTIAGFGGALNEKGWDALSVLTAPARQDVLRAVFDRKSGLRFNTVRIPIGASDYASSRYTDDEFPGDYTMTKFNIDRDRAKLLPYIKSAMLVEPTLKAWASAWTPPTWMKTNGAFDRGAMKDDPKIYDAYALYLAKFVESYRAEGIDLGMVVPQNEPGQLTDYPSCDWTSAQYLTFIRDHAGPLFAKRKPGAQLWLGTINVGTFDVDLTLRDATAAGQIGGIALQWDGFNQIKSLHAAYPKIPIMQSETDCGNHYWEKGFDPNKPQNDFAYGAMTWRKMHDWFLGGASSYMLWNIVLDELGMSIDAKQPWPQNAAIVVDKTSGAVTYTPMFWGTRHFSGVVDVGASLLQISPENSDAIAFENPDGTLVVELLNESTTTKNVKVAAKGMNFAVELPGASFATLVVPSPSTATQDGGVPFENTSHFEAELATLLGKAVPYSDQAASGGGGVAYLNVAGDGIRLNGTKVGTGVKLHYAALNGGSISVFVNGKRAGAINFKSTGGWTGTYADAILAPLDIPEGASVEVKRAAGDIAANLDYVDILPVP